ncbi:HNH endonuclease signature motif containing protein, partial [Nakamurella aerolata]
DHRIPYQAGGATSADNLNLLCKHHHRAKDGGGWTLTRTSDGTYHWTSPLGRTHTREPETWWQPTETTGDRAADASDQSVAANSGGADLSPDHLGTQQDSHRQAPGLPAQRPPDAIPLSPEPATSEHDDDPPPF